MFHVVGSKVKGVARLLVFLMILGCFAVLATVDAEDTELIAAPEYAVTYPG